MLYVNLAGDFRSTQEIEKRILGFLEKAGEPNQLETLNKVAQYNEYSVEAGIFGYSQLSNADIIALPKTQGRQGLAHFFSGSIGEGVNHSDLPVITFKGLVNCYRHQLTPKSRNFNFEFLLFYWK